jgi:hypothetical protein
MHNYQPTKDLLGRPIIDPYPELNDYWVNPLSFWLTVRQDYAELPRDPDVFFSMLTTELLIKHEQVYIKDIVRSPRTQEDGWTFCSQSYYIPVPNRPLLIRLKCRDDFIRTLYFKAEALVDNGSVQYLDSPSISPTNPQFYAYAIEDPSRKWTERILKTDRRQEMRNGKHHYQVKPYDETQALYKCYPGKTYLIQDCYWGQALENRVPEIKANKQILIMSDEMFQERLLAAQQPPSE